jgi:NAD(P)-dependent dehydrogenase (short-subunit alcohol dehydrogenase family)
MRALITGASRGLGAGIAGRLARDGWDLALIDITSELFDTVDRLAPSAAGALIPGVVDIRDVAAVEAYVARVGETLDGLDLVVNNAGIGGPSLPLVDSDISELRTVLEVNLLGVLIVTRAAIPLLRRSDNASVINLGSLYGHHPVANDSSYCASKGGVDALTKSLALELAPAIRVNGVAPGLMDTEMHWAELRAQAAASGTAFEALASQEATRVPLARHGTAEDVAGVIAWLASADAAYVTGQMIRVDGGVVVG